MLRWFLHGKLPLSKELGGGCLERNRACRLDRFFVVDTDGNELTKLIK